MDAACRLYYYREDFAFAILHAVVEGANADVKKPNDIDQSEGTPGAIDEGELSLGGGSSEDDEGIVSDDNVKSTYAYLIGNALLHKLSLLACSYISLKLTVEQRLG